MIICVCRSPRENDWAVYIVALPILHYGTPSHHRRRAIRVEACNSGNPCGAVASRTPPLVAIDLPSSPPLPCDLLYDAPSQTTGGAKPRTLLPQPVQQRLPGGIDECHSGQVDDGMLPLTPCQLAPRTIEFLHPWARQTPFDDERDRLRSCIVLSGNL